MKRRIMAGLLAIVLGFSGCGSPETAETLTTPANSNAATFEVSTTAETTTTTHETTSAIPEGAEKTFPIIDGSTSTIKLDAYLRSKILGIDMRLSNRETLHNKTFEAFENLVNGKTDIVLSVPLAKEQEAFAAENNFEYEAVPVAMEGFVFLVNPENPVQSLTQDEIRKIYSGEITNWKELGGNDAPIEAYQRNVNSGSQNYMTEFMGDLPLTEAPREFVQITMGGVVAMFADFDNSINAIGYSVYSYAAAFAANEGTFNFVEIDGVKPSRTTFIDKSYPLLSETYAFYKKDTTDPLVLDYIDLITSEKGQHYVLEAGYIPVMDIEIPDSYTLYEAIGTGETAPENINHNYYELDFYTDKDFNKTRPRGFLKDAEFEAEIQAWIDEAEIYYENLIRSEPCSYYAEIKNGYLGITVGDIYLAGVWDFEELYGKSAVFDIVNKKQIENLSDMFYKDTDFMRPINKSISARILDVYYAGELEFFGLCSDFTFDLSYISLLPDNAYFNYPPSFDVDLGNSENSVVSHCRDFSDYITTEFADKIKFVEYKENTSPYTEYYEKNGHVYIFYDYPDVENDRELPENKNIEETLDAWYADGGYDGVSMYISTEGVFVDLSIFDLEGGMYCTIQHKFITLDDLFKEGFAEHLTIVPNEGNPRNLTAQEIYSESYYGKYSYDQVHALDSIINQLYNPTEEEYLILEGAYTYPYIPKLRIDKKWLKDIYQNLPTE